VSTEQGEHDEVKAANMKIEELQRIDETHSKQMKFLEQTRLQLEQRIATMHTDTNKLKTG